MSNRGFTVLEVLVTIAIFAIGILALTKMQMLSVKGTGFNRETTVATALAQEVIEAFKGDSFGSIPSTCGTTQNGMAVTCTTSMNGTSPFRYHDIAVTIAWGLPTKQITVSTAIAEP